MGKILFVIYLISVWSSFISYSFFIKRFNNPNSHMKDVINGFYSNGNVAISQEMFIKKITNIFWIFFPVINLTLFAFHLLMIKVDKKVTKELEEINRQLEERIKELKNVIQEENLEELIKKIGEDLEKEYFSDNFQNRG